MSKLVPVLRTQLLKPSRLSYCFASKAVSEQRVPRLPGTIKSQKTTDLYLTEPAATCCSRVFCALLKPRLTCRRMVPPPRCPYAWSTPLRHGSIPPVLSKWGWWLGNLWEQPWMELVRAHESFRGWLVSKCLMSMPTWIETNPHFNLLDEAVVSETEECLLLLQMYCLGVVGHRSRSLVTSWLTIPMWNVLPLPCRLENPLQKLCLVHFFLQSKRRLGVFWSVCRCRGYCVFNASLVGLDAFHWTVPTSPCSRNRTGSATRCSLYWSNVPWRIICKWQIEPQMIIFFSFPTSESLFCLWHEVPAVSIFGGVKGDPLPFEATQWWQLVWMLGQLFHLRLLVRRWRQKSATIGQAKQFNDISIFWPSKVEAF